MLENFIYAKEKSLFEEALNNGKVLDEAIVFIEDTKQIWNHGTYFATQLSINEIENIVSSSETVQSVMEQIVLDTLDSLPVSIVSDGDGTKFLSNDGSYKEVGPYIWNGTTSETIFNELKEAIEANRTIILGAGYNYTAIDKAYSELSSDITLTFINKKCDPFGPYWIFTITSSNVVRKFTGSGIHYLENTLMLEPNCYSKFNEVPLNLNFTFSTNYVEHYKNRYIYEYQGEFSFGDTVYTITFPEEVIWDVTPVYRPNKRYQFSIVNNLGVMREFPLSNS